MAEQPGEDFGLRLSQEVWRRLSNFPKCGKIGKGGVNRARYLEKGKELW